MEDKYSFYMKGSNGKAVLLAHGLTGAPAEMRYVGKYLNKHGFTVYCPLLNGHGLTETDLVKTKWQDWYKSIEEGAAKLKEETEEVYAAGICVGAILALKLAHDKPNMLKGVALYSATFNYDGWSVPFYYPMAYHGLPIVMRFPFARQILRHWKFKETFPYGIKSERLRKLIIENVSGGIEGTLPYFPAISLNENCKLFREVRRNIPSIKTPVLLLHAKEDDVAHSKHSVYIKENIGGPAALHLLEDSYHMIHVDQERQKVAEMTAEFFNNN